MYKRYYDGYAPVKSQQKNGEIIIPEVVESPRNGVPETAPSQNVEPQEISLSENRKTFSIPFDTDDLILIGVLLFLFLDKDKCDEDGKSDMFMLIIIGIILFSDIL